MAITAIRAIRNLVPNVTYQVRNLEHPSDTDGPGHVLTVNPYTVVQCNMWIPWCGSQQDFDNKHKIIIVPVGIGLLVNFAIWQQDNYVRYSRDGRFYRDGPLVHGNCIVGGERSVEIRGTQTQDADLYFF